MTGSPDTPPPYERRRVGWLSLTQLITWGSVFYTFAVLLEPVERELGLTRAQSSLAFSLALFAEGLLAVPVGRWIDRGHERAVMTVGSLVMAAGLAAHACITTLAGFYAVWTVMGAAFAATLYTPVFSIVTRRYPDDYRRAIITLTFLGGLASTVFIPLSSWLVQRFGWREALWILAALHLLLCAPLHAAQLRGAPPPVQRRAVDGGSISSLLRSPAFLLVAVFTLGMTAVNGALPPHLVSLLRASGLGEAWVIAIPAAIGVIQVLGRLLLFFFEHHFDVHVANRVIPVLIPLGVAALLASGGHPAMALAFVVLYGLGNGMITIVKGTAIPEYVDRDHVAALNGALGLPGAISRALAPMVVGVLWTAQSGYTWGLMVLLAVSSTSVVALYLAQRFSLRGR